jgi:hypothetical protein
MSQHHHPGAGGGRAVAVANMTRVGLPKPERPERCVTQCVVEQISPYHPTHSALADRGAFGAFQEFHPMQEIGSTQSTKANVLSGQELSRIDAYWRAANYLSIGQIYLLDNPLLHQPLKPEHIKPRLLGHWGTTPGLNFIYAHLNRIIKSHDLNMIYICGPGHGGPAMVANTYLEGTYSEIYPSIEQGADGLRTLFRQFSFPGGIPSTPLRKRPARYTKVGSSAIPLRTPTAPRSTIRT